MDAAAGGNGAHDLLEHHHVVGGLRGLRGGSDLVLAVAAFVMAVLRAHAHLLHGQADVPAEVLACVQRGTSK